MIKGGIFTLNDLNTFKAKIRTPVEVSLRDNYRLLALPPPSSGVLVSLILNVMSSKWKNKYKTIIQCK